MYGNGRTRFNSSPDPTIGVEIELFILDGNDLNLSGGAPKILSEFDGDIRVKPELLDSIIEINTGICPDTTAVRNDLVTKIREVMNFAESNGMSLISMGTHPFARWSDAQVSNNERYQTLLNRMKFPVRRLMISGLHVHVGLENGEKCIAIMNGLLRYIPHFIGLSANSPFIDGAPTGLASTRTKIFEGLPTAGIPARLVNYSDFQRFMRTLQKANAIESIREVWWDIRPHPGFGTIEIRLCDAPPTVNDMVSLAALAQSLVVALSTHYDKGSQLPILSEWIVRENKWRATRYGLDAEIIVDDEGNQQTLRASVLELLEKISPFAIRLGCAEDLFALESAVETNPPYMTQLRRYNGNGDFIPVLKAGVDDLKRDL